VNANFGSDRAYGVRSSSNGNWGHHGRLRWRQKRQPLQSEKTSAMSCHSAHIKKRHINWYYKNFDTILIPNTSQLIFSFSIYAHIEILICTLIFD